jgi:glycosyltransferase involved in cell wall biosynthesis
MKGMYAAVERLLCPLTDALTHISVTQFREAERRRVTARHSVVVYNAIADRPLPSLARAEEGPVNLLFAGMFRPQKGLDILLRAMAHLEDAPIRLDVVGAGIDGQERILGATSNVTFHGWKRREDIETMYATTDALILPSRWDGHSMSGLEAMRAGAPLIVSNRGGLPELVDYGSAGLIFELSETDTSDLERVLRGITRSELRRLGSAARKRFETHYTGDVMHRSTVELYASLRREDVHKQAVSEPPQ